MEERKMRNVPLDVLYCLIVAALFLAPFARAAGNDMIQSKPCDTHKGYEQCDTNERCAQNSEDEEPQCICKRGYERIAGVCTQEPTTVVISTTTVQPDLKHNSGVVGVLLYFGARRYKWLQRFRQFRQNRYGNVLVTRDDDDDDDPPIA
ncbi:uncharacterized protein LOC143375334 isoform X2 [Andrena cerasifolii]|uniref:uncharacterized protein LOC143375334 isoform X2 n=1 Tax=Andrena cerasifolii TaxID=2819439 RepID=UPI00403833F7